MKRDHLAEGVALVEPSDDGGASRRITFAYLRTDGTAYIVAGSAVAGLAGYAYQLLGGRTLGARAFAPVSVLLTIHFLTLIVVMMPIEQLLVRRLTLDRSRRGVPDQALWLAGATVFVATAVAALGVDDYLNGDYRFIAFTTLTVAGHFVYSAARGHLAGWRRFRAYGLSSGGASLLRLIVAIAVTIVHPSASGFAVGLIIGPAVVMFWRPFRAVSVSRPTIDPDSGRGVSERGLLTGLVLASATSQALLLAGPLLVGALGGSAVAISTAFAVFTLGRAPLVFGYNLLARVLPPFTEMAARGQREELRSWAKGMAWAGVALTGIGVALGWFLGPWVVQIAFGPEFIATRVAAAIVSGGVVLAGSSLFVGQILVARGKAKALAVAWLLGLVAAAASIPLTSHLDVVARTATAFTTGEVMALGALVIGAVRVEDDRQPAGSMATYRAWKRTVDIAVSLFVLITTAPLLLLAGVAVRLDSPGPVFYRQPRVGRGGALFGMIKIRTMRADLGEDVFSAHLARLETARHDETGPALRIEDDPRVTAVGSFMRRWSIDELPNLWNVLIGQMSLVGPRPLVPAEAGLVGLENPRFTVKPGVTGLAQVEGRDTISIAERTRLDEEYVAMRNVSLDLRLLVRTTFAVITKPDRPAPARSEPS